MLRRPTWIPVFERARLAFELCDEDDSVTPQEAKEAADWTLARFPRNYARPPREIVAYAADRIARRRQRAA